MFVTCLVPPLSRPCTSCGGQSASAAVPAPSAIRRSDYQTGDGKLSVAENQRAGGMSAFRGGGWSPDASTKTVVLVA